MPPIDLTPSSQPSLRSTVGASGLPTQALISIPRGIVLQLIVSRPLCDSSLALSLL